jgi:hypothetical protein
MGESLMRVRRTEPNSCPGRLAAMDWGSLNETSEHYSTVMDKVCK